MKLGKVIGMVWADKKVPSLASCRLQIVRPITSKGDDVDRPLVVADPGNIAGAGDTIVYVTGTDAVLAFDSEYPPVNACVVELIDSID
jgi:ethanolamine utilization protein EutN